MQHNNFTRSFLFNHTTPKVRGAGALRLNLNLVRRLDNSHLSLLGVVGQPGQYFLYWYYYYSCSAGVNVKNMLKSCLDLWNTSRMQWH
jgi:hypothetical protein